MEGSKKRTEEPGKKRTEECRRKEHTKKRTVEPGKKRTVECRMSNRRISNVEGMYSVCFIKKEKAGMRPAFNN